ncbi:hypothetical protein A0123_03038 [Gluconobacter cerinus]|uniref:Uncharacterized protein n=1 Tax=Gluconobacter cerinus TaxID=38307 RepID=A0A1B6VGL5_9PROT|nr:hypothetical protein A0123_03038 [Gluconobacter cerinus]
MKPYYNNACLHDILYIHRSVNLSSNSLTARVAKCYRRLVVFGELCIFATVRGEDSGVPKISEAAFGEYPHSVFAWLTI